MSRRAALAIFLLAIAPSARAEQAGARPKVAVLELKVSGNAVLEMGRLEKNLEGGLYSGGFDVVQRANVVQALSSAPNLAGCTSTPCLEQLGALVGAERFVSARIHADGKTFELSIDLLGADVEGGLVVHKEASCDICSDDDVNDQLSKLAQSLGDAPEPELPVAFRSAPDGAAVRVDGTVLGRAPVDATLAPGSHKVEARLAGHLPLAEQIEVVEQPDGGAQEVLLSLRPGGAQRYRIWKWAAAAAGVVALGTGLYLISIDDGCTTSVPDGHACPRVYNTVLGGTMLTVAGVGLAGASVYFFWADRKAGAGLSGSF